MPTYKLPFNVSRAYLKKQGECNASLINKLAVAVDDDDMMINFINVSRPDSLGKSHTNLGTQLIDIKRAVSCLFSSQVLFSISFKDFLKFVDVHHEFLRHEWLYDIKLGD